MRSIYLPCLQALTFSLLVSFNSSAIAVDKTLELATERGCLTCHNVKHSTSSKTKLAPSYEEIAARYKGRSNAVDYLTGRILEGTVDSHQNWKGEVNMRFMPPNVNVSKIEANKMATWILDIEKRPIQQLVIKHEKMIGLAIRSGCSTCHAINPNPDHRYVPLAPSYREIAEKYAGLNDGRRILINSVVHGTLNNPEHWKNVNMRFMPPNLALSVDNAGKLVDWILSL